MVLGDFGLGDVLWSMFWFFMFILWIWLLIAIFGDLFRDHELSGWAKAAWAIFIIVLPFLGILLYLIVRGGKMGARAAASHAQAQQEFDQYVKSVAGSGGGTAAELERLASLRDRGVISAEEFEQLKAKAVG